MKQFFINVFIYTIGSIINRLSSFLIVPLIVRIFPKEDVGAFNITLSFMSFFITLGTLQLDQSFGRYYSDRNYMDIRKEIYSTSINSMVIFSLFLLSLFVVLNQHIITAVLNNLKYDLLFKFILLATFCGIINSFLINVYRWQGRPHLFVLFSSLNLLVNILSLLSLIYIFNMDILALGVSMLISNLLTSLISFYMLRDEYIFRINISLLKKLLKFSLPLLPYAFSIVLLNFIDRFMIRIYLGLSDVAIYFVAYKIASIFTFLSIGFQKAWGPYAYSHMRNEGADINFSKIFDLFTVFGSLTVIVIAFISPYLISVFATNHYLEAYKVVPFLSLGLLFYSLLYFGIGIFLSERTYFNLIVSLIGIILNIYLNNFLIPRLGLIGAAISTLVSYFSMAVINIYISQKLFYINYNITKNFLVIIFVMASLIMIIFVLKLNPFSIDYAYYYLAIICVFMVLVKYVYKLMIFNIRLDFMNNK